MDVRLDSHDDAERLIDLFEEGRTLRLSTEGLARPKHPQLTVVFHCREHRAELPGRALAWGHEAVVDLGKSSLEFRIFLERLEATAAVDLADESWLDSAINNQSVVPAAESASQLPPFDVSSPSFIDALESGAPVETGTATANHAVKLLLHQASAPHLLKIWSESRWWYLFAQEGRVVRAYIRPAADWSSVLVQLAKQGHLDPETATRLSEEAHEQQLPEDLVLSKADLVSNRFIEKTCEAQVRFALGAVSKLSDVEFSICPLPSTPFRDGSAWRTGAFNLTSRDGRQGLFKSRVNAYLALDRDAVRDMLAPHLDARPCLTESAGYIADQVGLPDSAVRFIQALDGARQLKQFMRSGSMRQEHAFSLLFSLLDTGFVSWPGAPEPHHETSVGFRAEEEEDEPLFQCAEPSVQAPSQPKPKAIPAILTPVPDARQTKKDPPVSLHKRLDALASQCLFTRLGVPWFASRDEIQDASVHLVREMKAALQESKVVLGQLDKAHRIVSEAPTWAAKLSVASQRRAHRQDVVSKSQIEQKLQQLDSAFSKALNEGDRSQALGLLASFKELDPDLGRVRHREAARRF